MVKLSVILITYNEAHNIIACLQSVNFADEIIVVDSGSTDDTVNLAQQAGAKVLVTDWPGYGKQKNRALALATGDWVLSIDADERISFELATEIKTLLADNEITSTQFSIPFHSFFLGKRIRFGDWQAEKHVRLFKRSVASFDNAGLHENLLISGPLDLLKHPILHEPYRDWAEIYEKIERYAILGRKILYQKKKTFGLVTAVLHGWWAFLRSFIFRAGFLDGRAGFWLAVTIAQYTYRRYR